MKKLVTMTITAAVDGDNFHMIDSTETHGNSWADVYRGMIMIKEEVERQIADGKKCPFNPKNVRLNGEPDFTS